MAVEEMERASVGAGEAVLRVLAYLPIRAREAVASFLCHREVRAEGVSEVRLRADAPLSVTYFGRSAWRFDGEAVVLDEREVTATLGRLCEDSVHTYGECIKEGFAVLSGGYRIGVVGRAGSEGDTLRSVGGISSLSIRIPRGIVGAERDILGTVVQGEVIYPTLFFSPPNVGKTTLLRGLCLALSSGDRARRTAVIDTRGEIYIRSLFARSLADILSFYPRGKGIEIATRTMSPEVILCDEIGSPEEANAILSAQNSGVPLIATAHGDAFERLILRPSIRLLYEHRVFRYYIGLQRPPTQTRFSFDVTDTWAEK